MRLRLNGLTRASLLLLAIALDPCIAAQSLPAETFRLMFRHYTDSFGVDVLYPSASIQKQTGAGTSVSARYVVDAITSASMRSRFEVDGVTSATHKSHGGTDGSFDEIRQEATLGVTQRLGDGIGTVHGILGNEHDYRSATLALSVSYPFAQDNTELRVGLVRGWDELFPVHRDWTRDKDVTEATLGFTQVLSPRTLLQVNYSHREMRGLLSDPYQVVTILDPETRSVSYLEAVHPTFRGRNAVGFLVRRKTSSWTSAELGYRRYWDSWSVESHTVHALVQARLGRDAATVGLLVRGYDQTRADFFRPEYTGGEAYRTADVRLDSNVSFECDLEWALSSTLVRGLGIVDERSLSVEGSFGYYQRRTDSRDWHSRSRTLHALVSRIGLAYAL